MANVVVARLLGGAEGVVEAAPSEAAPAETASGGRVIERLLAPEAARAEASAPSEPAPPPSAAAAAVLRRLLGPGERV